MKIANHYSILFLAEKPTFKIIIIYIFDNFVFDEKSDASFIFFKICVRIFSS